MDKKSVVKNYAFLGVLLVAMVLGCIAGWLFPAFAGAIKPLGTVFINMMFCVVVPLVFASIAGAIACIIYGNGYALNVVDEPSVLYFLGVALIVLKGTVNKDNVACIKLEA